MPYEYRKLSLQERQEVVEFRKQQGYVKDVYDWPWSSVFVYEGEKGREWLKEQWNEFMPDADFGKDWDM